MEYYDVIFRDTAQEMRERLMAPARFVQIKTAQVVGATPEPVLGAGASAPTPTDVPQANQAVPPDPSSGLSHEQLLQKTITDLERSPVIELFMRQSQPITPSPQSQEIGPQGVASPQPTAQGQGAPLPQGAPAASTKYAAALKKLKVKTPSVPKAPTGTPSAKQTINYKSPKVTADWSAPSKPTKAISAARDKLPRAESTVSLNAKKQAPYRGRKENREEM